MGFVRLSIEEKRLYRLLKRRNRISRIPLEEIHDNEDNWHGSLDDQEKILEDHVSRRGWEF